MSAEPVEVRCTARPWAVEPNCQCPIHLPLKRRGEKMRRLGHRRPDLSVQAWAALDRMLAAGRTVSDIAATAGIDRNVLSAMLRARRVRNQKKIVYARAKALIAAEGMRPAGGLVDATPSRRRLQALAVAGWTQREVASRVGVDSSVMSVIRSGRVAHTSAAKAAAISAVYAELSERSGPSKVTSRAAVAAGWASPEAWRDIDDLSEVPEILPPETGLDLGEAMWLAKAGCDREVAARRLGLSSWKSLRDALHNRPGGDVVAAKFREDK